MRHHIKDESMANHVEQKGKINARRIENFCIFATRCKRRISKMQNDVYACLLWKMIMTAKFTSIKESQ